MVYYFMTMLIFLHRIIISCLFLFHFLILHSLFALLLRDVGGYFEAVIF